MSLKDLLWCRKMRHLRIVVPLYIILLTFSACGQRVIGTSATSAPREQSKLVGPPHGSFTVSATLDSGVMFQNRAPEQHRFEFSATGLWSFAAAAGMLGPSGADTPAGPNYPLPGGRSFALVARRSSGAAEFVGAKASITLAPGEVLYFMMNEASGAFADNRDQLVVNWSQRY